MYTALYGEKENLGVSFPSYADAQSIQMLYDNGVMKYESYCNFLSSHLDISLSSFVEEDPRAQKPEVKPTSQKTPKVMQPELDADN